MEELAPRPVCHVVHVYSLLSGVVYVWGGFEERNIDKSYFKKPVHALLKKCIVVQFWQFVIG